MKLNDIRVSSKMWGTILGLLVLMLAVQAFTQFRSSQVMREALAETQRFEQQITLATQWRGLTLTNNERAMAELLLEDEKVLKWFEDRRKATSEVVSQLQKQISANDTSEANQQAMASVLEGRAAMLAVRSQASGIKASGDRFAITDFALNKLEPSSKTYMDALDDFVSMSEKRRDAATVAAHTAQRNATLVGMVSSAVVFVLAILLAIVLIRSITRPLSQAVAIAEAIAGGDLTQNIQETRKDEFGQLLQALSGMVGKLHSMVTEVHRGVDSVSTASTQIANGNLDLSSRTEQTAANLEETAASMEELTSTVTQSSETAQQANQLATSAAKAAAHGGEVVGQVVASMQQISDSSRKIADIIGVIDGIAFQTNILALNAAVEAARAGEQGRGFAVVASEVRSLAQRSADAAKEIKTLISASVTTVETGSAQVVKAGQAMEEIVTGVRRVTDLIGEIAAAAHEQRDGIGQVNQAVTNLDQMTQQNASLVEESAAAAASLRDQAQYLAEVVSVFNVGAVAAPPPAAARAPVPRPVMKAPASIGTVPRAVGSKTAAKLAPSAARLSSSTPPAAKKPFASPAAPASSASAGAPRAQAKGGDDDWESF